MSCPTCDHTMACLYAAGGEAIYHCPRCGTVRHSAKGEEFADEWRPILVDRCRQFESSMQDYVGTMAEWKRSGIAESINIPRGRK